MRRLDYLDPANTEFEHVYRIRNKKTGQFYAGGHSARAGIFTSEKACKGVMTYHELSTREWEILKYKLVLVLPNR